MLVLFHLTVGMSYSQALSARCTVGYTVVGGCKRLNSC